MERSASAKVVPLEAGAGPENPPCPACGEPLFGWLGERPWIAGSIRRCESCGLGAIGAAGDSAAALRALDALEAEESGRYLIANRAGFACSLGGAGWAGLGPEARYLFTPEAVRRLVAQRDQVVKSLRWAPGASLAATWQTLLNSVTFGHNVALGALGRGIAVRPGRPWQRAIDGFASIVLAIPALAIALPVELAGAPFGRGAVLKIETELL